jgi:outer membrane protein assembly factor BamB
MISTDNQATELLSDYPGKPYSGISSYARCALLVVMSLTLTACGISETRINPMNWFGDEEVNPPTELVQIEQEINMLRKWSVRVGNGQGDTYNELTPAIDGPTIFAASENGNVLAIELETGDVIWRSRLGAEITGGVGAGEGLVMVGTTDAEIVALSQSDGEVLWRAPVSSEVLSPPQTSDELVVAQTIDGKLVALEIGSGEQRWIYETTLPALTLRGTSKPVITSFGSVIAGFSNGTLVSVAADNGVFRWEERVAIPEGRYDIDRVIDVDGDLLVSGDVILASSYQGNLMAFDIQTGRIVWGREASSYHGLGQGFGNLYYCDDSGHVVAVRNNSEDLAWENDNLTYRSLTAPATIGNYVAVADFEGYVHLLSQIDGRIVGRTQIDDDGIRANLLANSGTLYVFSNSGRLTALTLQ